MLREYIAVYKDMNLYEPQAYLRVQAEPKHARRLHRVIPPFQGFFGFLPLDGILPSFIDFVPSGLGNFTARSPMKLSVPSGLVMRV